MKHNRRYIQLITFAAFAFLLSTGNGVNAQEQQPLFSKEEREQAERAAPQQIQRGLPGCKGKITQVLDVGDENVRITRAVFGTSPGGGQGQQFDKTPVLSTRVRLSKGTCLDAHLSAIVGSQQAYGVSRMTFFQVTLTPANGGPPRHMVGHFETPFGFPSPAVALEAERDVDMYASNFFQRVGNGPHDVPPGTYRVDVWWAGGPPPAPGGASAIGAAFVLKLYLR